MRHKDFDLSKQEIDLYWEVENVVWDLYNYNDYFSEMIDILSKEVYDMSTNTLRNKIFPQSYNSYYEPEYVDDEEKVVILVTYNLAKNYLNLLETPKYSLHEYKSNEMVSIVYFIENFYSKKGLHPIKIDDKTFGRYDFVDSGVKVVDDLLEDANNLRVGTYFLESSDVEVKTSIILKYGKVLEGERDFLIDNYGKSFVSDIFNWLNNFNLRHNNIENGRGEYKELLDSLSEEDAWKLNDRKFAIMVSMLLLIKNFKPE